MKLRVLTSPHDFTALAPVWRDLTNESGQTSPFLSHDWFACCWQAAAPGVVPEVWVVEDTGGALALLPLARSTIWIRGMRIRVLRLLDSPDTQFVDVPTVLASSDVIVSVLDRLRACRDWDLMSFAKLPSESATVKALTAALPGRFGWRVGQTIDSPYIAMTGTWDGFLRTKTQRFRKTLRHIANRIRRGGDVTVEVHRDVDPAGRLFAEIMDVSLASWKGPRNVAIATMNGMPRFFRELTSRASRNGWLHLWILRISGRAVATEYQLAEGARRHALRADFDSSLAEFSPGGYLNHHIARCLFEEGSVLEYDMGPGTNEYKMRWANGVHKLLTIDVYAPTVMGRMLRAAETTFVPFARQWRSRIRRTSREPATRNIDSGGAHEEDS